MKCLAFRLIAILAVHFVLIQNVVYGDDSCAQCYSQPECEGVYYEDLSQETNPCMETVCVYPCYQSIYTYPSCLSGCQLYVSGDLLYMTVYQSNLDYALDSDPAFPDIDTPWALATRENFKYDWEFGYRAVIGLQFDCSSIGSKVMYTHYKNSHKEKVLDELGRAASTTLFPGSDERLFERIRSSLELDYDLVDWVFDHRLKTWQKCHIIPFIGFRTLRLEQEMLIKHHDFIDEENPKTTISFDSETKSAGILGGLDVCFCSDCGFGLYGQFGCSILGARYEVTSEQFRFDDDGEIDELAVNENSITEEKIYSGLFGCQGALGFTYNLRCNCVDIDFMLGYELNYWNHIPSFRRFTSQVATVYTNGTSHLLLHGGVFRAAVRF